MKYSTESHALKGVSSSNNVPGQSHSPVFGFLNFLMYRDMSFLPIVLSSNLNPAMPNFHHTPYLDDFNKENGTHIVSVAAIHVEPMGIYSTSHKTLDDIKK